MELQHVVEVEVYGFGELAPQGLGQLLFQGVVDGLQFHAELVLLPGVAEVDGAARVVFLKHLAACSEEEDLCGHRHVHARELRGLQEGEQVRGLGGRAAALQQGADVGLVGLQGGFRDLFRVLQALQSCFSGLFGAHEQGREESALCPVQGASRLALAKLQPALAVVKSGSPHVLHDFCDGGGVDFRAF